MKSLSESQQSKLSDLQYELESAQSDVESALEQYNNAVQELDSFRDRIVRLQTKHIAAQTAEWLESDEGQAYEEWKTAWEDASLEELDTYLDFDAVDVAQNLPEDVE